MFEHVCHSSTLAPSLARYARQARGVPAPSQGIRADLQTFIPMQRFVARRARVDRACRFQAPGQPQSDLSPDMRCPDSYSAAGEGAEVRRRRPSQTAGHLRSPRAF
ncbi:unnamed protein product [Prorocentrum cordatum]|uniref:Uncharacterized protein n=1 Tax=Prorocentrum cordatum TaxID=2364126 RepID=A0ABN9WZB2_9DINO|nr:unnamed protein product [Polarella glacialis]